MVRFMYEMNEEQQRLFEALTPLQKEISLNSIAGMNDIDAYKNSKGKSKKENTMRASVCEILANPNVKLFMTSMVNHIVNPAIMSRNEALETLTRLARVNLPVNENGYLELDKITKEQLEALEQVQISDAGIKVKNYSKLSAIKQLSDIAGYNDPIRVEQTTSQINYDIKSSDPKKAAQEYMELIKRV